MRPVDHMKPSEDEIIAHIKDSLATYEEDYVPGAWEQFSEKDASRPALVLWISRIGSAAAVVLIGMTLFWFTNNTPVKTPNIPSDGMPEEVVQLKSDAKSEAQSKNISSRSVGSETVAEPLAALSFDQPILVNEEPATTFDQHLPAEVKVTLLAVVDAPQITSTGIVPEVNSYQETKPTSIEAFLKDESASMASAEKMVKVSTKDNKWALGVVVSPSLGNAGKLNMGYGVSMGYALTDRVSLSSGISYNEMAASRSVASPTSMDSPNQSALVGETKNLESIEKRVTGIDIPLDVKYNLSKNIYANIGVSAFAVIDQRRNNNYIQERLVERSSTTVSASNDYKTIIVSEKVSENAPESEVQRNDYLGFYNFSFGYKQKVGKDKSIAIEPFMKVPMKEVTRDNLRLMGTGVKLRFDF